MTTHRAILLTTLSALAFLSMGADKSKKAGKADKCPVVGVADLDKDAKVSNYTGMDLPKAGTELTAFDVDGKIGKLKVRAGEGDLAFSGSAPSRVASTAFTHVLVVDGKLGSAHLGKPGDDLPQGTNAEAVQMILVDGSGPRAVLRTVTSFNGEESCNEIDSKVAGAWQKCWSDCQGGK